METYLRLTDVEQVEYARRAREEGGTVETIELTWSEQRRREGWEQGVAEGRQQGVAEGRQQGLALGEARALMRVLRVRFGQLPDDLEARLAALDATTLDRLADRVLPAATLGDVLAGL